MCTDTGASRCGLKPRGPGPAECRYAAESRPRRSAVAYQGTGFRQGVRHTGHQHVRVNKMVRQRSAARCRSRMQRCRTLPPAGACPHPPAAATPSPHTVFSAVYAYMSEERGSQVSMHLWALKKPSSLPHLLLAALTAPCAYCAPIHPRATRPILPLGTFPCESWSSGRNTGNHAAHARALVYTREGSP